MVEKPGKRIIIRGLTEEEYELLYSLKKKYRSWDEATRKFIIPIYTAIIKYKLKIIEVADLIDVIEELIG